MEKSLKNNGDIVKRRKVYNLRCASCLSKLWADDKVTPSAVFPCDCGCSDTVNVVRWLDYGRGTLLVTDGKKLCALEDDCTILWKERTWERVIGHRCVHCLGRTCYFKHEEIECCNNCGAELSHEEALDVKSIPRGCLWVTDGREV